ARMRPGKEPAMVQVASVAEPAAGPVRSVPARQATAMPRLSVVIVNYCQWENTAALVGQLRRSAAPRAGGPGVVLVDNPAPRHQLIGKLRRCRGVSLRRWGKNRGFARAANEGCRLSQGDWFLLLNPDISLSADFARGVVKLLDELEPGAGIVGFQLRNG